ncbi:MAG: bacteriohemerythrin [Rhodospirillum sp.]|nr:bacteriohemerythrin [Rhodospirillum sp.]MCF8488048.1 bacteriohemerythrin [Rhodospirillum sp.]MCF8501532.1 bacteriohemerythrin [Rhodospirillum sp.]
MSAGWTENCRVGIKAIDEDHKGLFDLVNAIDDHQRRGSRANQVNATVHALNLYVTEHFEREERFMRRAKFPGYEAHRRIHEDFRGLVSALIALHQKNPDAVDLRKVTAFLDSWIRNHILVQDMEYVPYLNGEASPEEGKNIASRYQDVSLRVPVDKVDAVERFAALMRNGGDIAQALEQALVIHERDHQRTLIKRAEKLFSITE